VNELNVKGKGRLTRKISSLPEPGASVKAGILTNILKNLKNPEKAGILTKNLKNSKNLIKAKIRPQIQQLILKFKMNLLPKPAHQQEKLRDDMLVN
jgi:hypothetical protein